MMNVSSKGALFFSFIVITICIISVVVGGSFSQIWIQHEVTKVAKKTVFLEKRHQKILEKIDHLDERIASEHQPIVLQTKVSNRLVPIKDEQIIWVESESTGLSETFVNTQNSQNKVFRN